MNSGKDQAGGVNISGAVGTVIGDIVGGNKITVNIINPIGKSVEAETSPGPNMYVDRKHQFSISWPKDSDWIPSSRMGAYQLSQLGVSTSKQVSVLFGLVKSEYQATFAVFKIQRPQGDCLGWVVVDVYPKSLTGNNLSVLVKLLAAIIIRSVRDSGGEIISQNIDSEGAAILYRQTTDPHPTNVRIIRGKGYVYSVSSPSYPLTSVYDTLREDTNAILNSFNIA